jgi:hypothetical protein
LKYFDDPHPTTSRPTHRHTTTHPYLIDRFMFSLLS